MFTLHVSGVLYTHHQEYKFELCVSTRPRWESVAETILWSVPVAVDTVENCTPDDGCIKHPKHVE